MRLSTIQGATKLSKQSPEHEIKFSILDQSAQLLSHGIIGQSYTPTAQLNLNTTLTYQSEGLEIQTTIGMVHLALEANQLILGAENFDREMTHVLFGITDYQILQLDIAESQISKLDTESYLTKLLDDPLMVMACLSYTK